MAATPTPLDRDEYVEQAYFFRTFRDRLGENMAAQDVLNRLHQELLTTTRLPLAVQFLATDMRHTGLLASGFGKLPHYFTAFQTFVVRRAEDEGSRFTTPEALLVLEREATYKAGGPTRPGLFVYQFETIARNRLGYDGGLSAMAADPVYDADWVGYLEFVRKQVGLIDFGDLVYLRSLAYRADRRREEPGYEPHLPPVFEEKEGRIGAASRGRDPLFLFAALQRQLGYPEVPRPKPKDDTATRMEAMQTKLREFETRLRLIESEVKGQVDLTQFGKPDIFKDDVDPPV